LYRVVYICRTGTEPKWYFIDDPVVEYCTLSEEEALITSDKALADKHLEEGPLNVGYWRKVIEVIK
jgi:hypothetical protein